MLALAKLQRHSAVLCHSENSELAAALALAFKTAAVPFAGGLIADNVLAALELDLLYCLVRHHHWCEAALFGAVVCDYIAQSYQLERPVAEALTRAMLAATRSLRPSSTAEDLNNHEFIRYICVVTAVAADENELVVDLGFGRNLLHRVKQALESLPTTPADASAAAYLPELDAEIAAVVGMLGRELARTPWALQVHRLRYLALDLGEPWQSWLNAKGAAWLFHLLLMLANHGPMHLKQLGRVFRQCLPNTPGLDEVALSELCQALGRCGFMALERGDHTWRSLPLTEELTAEAFASAFFGESTSEEQVVTALPGLCAHYQASLIRAIPAPSLSLLEKILLQLRPLSPLALKATTSRLAEVLPNARLHEMLSRLSRGEASACLRRAAAEAAAANCGEV